MRKAVSFIIAVAVMLTGVTVLGGCGKDGEPVDTGKTQLYVSNYNGGVGTGWLNRVKQNFEEAYAEDSFEEGKKGVQIIIDANKDLGPELTNKLPNSHNDVFFSEKIPYYAWARDGLILDISDAVTETLPGETVSIEGKLSGETQAMLKSHNGKYYGIPHYEGFLGVIYDADVFEQKNLYFAQGGGYVANASAQRSAGPDGVSGSDDDGLPVSVEQLKNLCATMTSRGVIPFIWTGQYSEYYTILLNALSTSLLGKAGSEVLYDFNIGKEGAARYTSEVITGFSGTTPVTQNVTIDETTGYYLFQQSANYYAVDFARSVLRTAGTKWYHSNSVNPTFSHLDAQESFIFSNLENKPVAMLIDGNYWENEAVGSGAFERSVNEKGDAAKNRNFKWMPLPVAATGNSASSKITLKDSLRTYAVVNAKVSASPARTALAKSFLKYCYGDAQLKDFTLTTGMTKNIVYDLSDEELGSLSSFSKSMWNYRKKADIVNTSSTSTLYFNAETALTSEFWKTTVSGTPYDRPYVALYSGNFSAEEYFKGMWKTPSAWDSSYREYFQQAD